MSIIPCVCVCVCVCVLSLDLRTTKFYYPDKIAIKILSTYRNVCCQFALVLTLMPQYRSQCLVEIHLEF